MGDQRVTRTGMVVIKSQNHRSLERNRAEAIARLQSLVAAAAHLPKPRRPTKPTRGLQAEAPGNAKSGNSRSRRCAPGFSIEGSPRRRDRRRRGGGRAPRRGVPAPRRAARPARLGADRRRDRGAPEGGAAGAGALPVRRRGNRPHARTRPDLGVDRGSAGRHVRVHQRQARLGSLGCAGAKTVFPCSAWSAARCRPTAGETPSPGRKTPARC